MTVAVELSTGSSLTSPDIKTSTTEQPKVAPVIPLFPGVEISGPVAQTADGLWVPRSYWQAIGRFNPFQRQLLELGIDPESLLGKTLSINSDTAEQAKLDNNRTPRLVLMSGDGQTLSDSQPILSSDNLRMLKTFYSLAEADLQAEGLSSTDTVREYYRHFNSVDREIGFIEVYVDAIEQDWSDFRVMVGSTALIDAVVESVSYGAYQVPVNNI